MCLFLGFCWTESQDTLSKDESSQMARLSDKRTSREDISRKRRCLVLFDLQKVWSGFAHGPDYHHWCCAGSTCLFSRFLKTILSIFFQWLLVWLKLWSPKLNSLMLRITSHVWVDWSDVTSMSSSPGTYQSNGTGRDWFGDLSGIHISCKMG